ncbi:MAG: hypothetical protein F4Y79_10345 [Gemmatimonadetes bacterium]|nr:hypothetical protein [Gemmatimonadota bacterium]
MMTQEENEKVQIIVRETIAERFSSDEFVFDPIVVVSTVDEYGSDASGERILASLLSLMAIRSNSTPVGHPASSDAFARS